MAERDLFKFAVNTDGAAGWQFFSHRQNGKVVAYTHQAYVDEFANDPGKFDAQVQSRAVLVLNATKKLQLSSLNEANRINKATLLSRDKYAWNFSEAFTEQQIGRFIRSVKRVRPAPLQRIHAKMKANLDTRRTALLESKVTNAEIAKKLSHLFMAHKRTEVLIRSDESKPRRSSTPEDFSATQQLRVHMQLFLVSRVYVKMALRDVAELEMIDAFYATLGNAPDQGRAFEDFRTQRAIFKTENMLPVLVEAVEKESAGSVYKASTILGWYQEYKHASGFFEDERGTHVRENWLEANDLTAIFTLWLSLQKSVNVKAAHTFLIEQRLKQPPRPPSEPGAPQGRDDDTSLTIGLDSVHRYMKQVGMQYCDARSCYFTDTHESPGNIRDRSERYIPEKIVFERRKAAFFRAPYRVVAKPALEFMRAIYGLGPNDDFPVKVRTYAPTHYFAPASARA
jgi:hypothetical protein